MEQAIGAGLITTTDDPGEQELGLDIHSGPNPGTFDGMADFGDEFIKLDVLGNEIFEVTLVELDAILSSTIEPTLNGFFWVTQDSLMSAAHKPFICKWSARLTSALGVLRRYWIVPNQAVRFWRQAPHSH